MTRLAFRATVHAPRPPAAWLMALVASAALWITGELRLWVIPVQLACFAFSFATRDDPPAWRKSPLWLNVGMFAITGVTISQALRGSPAPLSLAYFAALSQGLQLMDARPRKSEFLLVALALFQVILAANLTDSVFFPPLLVVFLVSVTWTLMVHTLRTEAAEAGNAHSAHRAITPGLLRNTLIASGVSILLALVLFMLLPRMRTSVLRGGAGPGLAMAGFSDRVSLGTIGRIRQDRTVVLRVETLEGEPPARDDAYWRGLAFDRFDGRDWSITTAPGRLARAFVSGSPRFGVDLDGGAGPHALVQRIVREPVEAGVLFGAGAIRRVEGPLDHLERDGNGGLYLPAEQQERIRYTLWTEPVLRDDRALRSDRTSAPPERQAPSQRKSTRYVELPDLDPRIARMAQRITANASSDAERLVAIESTLQREGRYTDEPPDHGGDGAQSPIESFLLGELAGHCEYFASGMVVLARSLGLPARLVSGFAGGRTNAIGGFTEVTRSDAHAWVEVHYAGAGWVRYDPTPPDLRLRGDGHATMVERIGDLASAVELWWFQRVVDFDSSDQILTLRSGWLFVRDFFEGWLATRRSATGPMPAPEPEDGRRPWRPGLDGGWSLALPISLAVALAIVLGLRQRRRNMATPVPRTYRRALALLARRGLRRAPSTTARRFRADVAAAVTPAAAACFERITEAYLAERFGGSLPERARARVEYDIAHLRRHLRER